MKNLELRTIVEKLVNYQREAMRHSHQYEDLLREENLLADDEDFTKVLFEGLALIQVAFDIMGFPPSTSLAKQTELHDKGIPTSTVKDYYNREYLTWNNLLEWDIGEHFDDTPQYVDWLFNQLSELQERKPFLF